MKTVKNLKLAGWGLAFVLLLAVGTRLLGTDAASFFVWWLAALSLGWSVWPLTRRLFPRFQDGGYLISKVFGIALSGFLVWVFVCIGLVPFTKTVCIVIPVLMMAVIWAVELLACKRKGNPIRYDGEQQLLWLEEEVLFLLLFLLWTYFAGFRPAAYGTEKFMDYGFMMTMMRSETLPAPDMWYANGALNYYYGGQYFAVFLTKLTKTRVEETYHLMRTMVASFAFMLPFVLMRQMIWDHKGQERNGNKAAWAGGLLAGCGVSLAGNMHYVWIGKVLPFVKEILGLDPGDYTYWFPNSTRYIGYYPAENDKTIHEFPSYSFVLGDLHAHVVNVMFVLALICLVYAMIQRYHNQNPATDKGDVSESRGPVHYPALRQLLREALLEPYVLVLAFFIGLFHWTNYWDFVIYYVFGGLGVIYCNYKKIAARYEGRTVLWLTALISLVHAIWVFLLGSLFALPFTLQFDAMISGVALAQNHSRFYQLLIVWGLPVAVTLIYLVSIFAKSVKGKKLPGAADAFGILLGISALGLILIPELVYVRDIYEKEYARSNTMFKLTYQAFMMFGLLMAYTFVRLGIEKRKYIRNTLLTISFVCFLGTCCYLGTAVHAWFGQVWDPGQYQGLDATAFLEKTYADDAAAIRWLNANVEGSPVVLEANGDSYSDYERVSAMTGLPTALGWYVHEWLWRQDPADLNQRSADVETMYTSDSPEAVEALLSQYQVSYIFVGKMEREKYPELNEDVLRQVGHMVFVDELSSTYILKVDGLE